MSIPHYGDTASSHASAREAFHQYTTLYHTEVLNVYTGYSVRRPSTYSGYYEIIQERVPKERYAPWSELFSEWPELGLVAVKLSRGERLDELDNEWVKEVSEATGWDPEDVLDELKSIGKNPSERAERYLSLYKEYLDKAKEHYERGDLRQAGEKLYGTALTLIKYYAAVKGVAVIYWSRGKLERFITSSVGQELRKSLRDLLDKVQTLHEHFYEEHLDEQTFKERWSEALELLERVQQSILSHSR